MTARIREFLATAPTKGPASSSTSTSSRDNYHAFAKALPDTQRLLRREGQSGAGDPARCWPRSARPSTPPRSPRSRWRSRPAPRPTASPSATPSRRSATSRAPIALGMRAVRGRLRRGGREDRARRARRARVLPRPDRRRRRRMAAVAQVRLRARRWPSTCWSTRTGSASTPMACRSMSARSRPTWTPGTARSRSPRRSSRRCAERGIVLTMVNLGGGFPTRYLQGRAGGEGLRPGDLPRAAQAFRQRASRRPSSSRAAAWSAMPASSRPRSC